MRVRARKNHLNTRHQQKIIQLKLFDLNNLICII